MASNRGQFKKGGPTWNKGLKNPMSEDGKKRMIQSKLGKPAWNKGKKVPKLSGKNHWNWKGGVNVVNSIARKSLEYKLWQDACFARDGYTCQKYGTVGGDIHVHHIQNFSTNVELRYAIDNGVTLSKKAHIEFHRKYGRKNNTREQLSAFLNQ